MKRLGQLLIQLLAILLLLLWDLIGWLVLLGWQKSGAIRANSGHWFSRLWLRYLQKPFWIGVIFAAISLVGVNAVVRNQGGGPGWFDIDHLRDKWVAVGKLLLHVPFHPFSSCSHEYGPMIAEAANHYQIPPALVEAVAFTESRFRPHTISSAGAMGIMQLMPGTAKQMGVWDPFSAEQNIYGGAKYLAFLWKRYDAQVRRVAAAYHAGPYAVPKQGPLRLGPRTTRYMRVVVRRYREYTERGRKHKRGRGRKHKRGRRSHAAG